MMQRAPLLALILEMSGQCVDRERVVSLIQNEVDMTSSDGADNEAVGFSGATSAPSSSVIVADGGETPPSKPALVLRISCGTEQASFTLTRGTRQAEGRVSLQGLDQDLGERTLALAIAEAFPLVEDPGLALVDAPKSGDSDTATETSSVPPALPKAEPPPQPDHPPKGDEATAVEPELFESKAMAGGGLRFYPSGVVMMGGVLDLRIRRLGLSATLLSTGGTVPLYGLAYTNLSLALSYVLVQVGSERIKGDWGVKVAGGFASSDTVLRGYVGASAFAAADISVTRTWRTRLEAEAGHAGWSQHEQIRQAQGFYLGAMLELGVGGNL